MSAPIGLFGTIWAYRMLREISKPHPACIDWPGSFTFAVGLVGIMVGIPYGIQPYGHHDTGWTSPFVLASLAAGVAGLALFAAFEIRVAQPMFRLSLFRIRAFTARISATFLAAVGRGGLMFTLIVWLQGISLPRHGYDFARTPLWAGTYMLPLTAGFQSLGRCRGSSRAASARPLRHRRHDPGGSVLRVSRELLPVNFPYAVFAPLLLLTLIILGLSSTLPAALYHAWWRTVCPSVAHVSRIRLPSPPSGDVTRDHKTGSCLNVG